MSIGANLNLRTVSSLPGIAGALAAVMLAFATTQALGEDPSSVPALERELRQERHWLTLEQRDYRRSLNLPPAAYTPGLDARLHRERAQQDALQQSQRNRLRALEAEPGPAGGYGPRAARKHLLLNRFETERRQQSQQQRELRRDGMMQDYRTYTPRPAPRIEALE